MNDYMLTTTDNPFDPFDQFDEWWTFDVTNGYNTCSYLDRIAKTSNELSEKDDDLAIRQAMQEIVDYNLNGKYIIVTKNNGKTVPILFQNVIKL